MRLSQIDLTTKDQQRQIDELFEIKDLPIQQAIITEDAKEYAGELESAQSEFEGMDETDDLEAAYDELSTLTAAMESGNFGLLIGKRGGRLDHNDILEIRREIADIFRNNRLFSGENIYRGKDGWERLRLVPQAIESSLNEWGSYAISAALAWTSIGFFASAGLATLPIIGLIGGAILSVLFLAAGIHNHFIHKSIKTAARVLNILDAYEDMNSNRKVDDRSTIHKFFDWLMRKSPSDIRADAQEKVQDSAKKAAKRFERLTKGLPDYIYYYDQSGDKKQYPTIELFTG